MAGKVARYLRFFCVLLVACIVSGLTPAWGASTAQRPFPQHVSYASGIILPDHVSRSTMDATVQSYYNTWQSTYVMSVPNTTPLQKFVFHQIDPQTHTTQTVSEAHGYGMVISAYMANQTDFDAMFYYFKAHPSLLTPHLMAWKQAMVNNQMVNTPDGEDSATDGDMDVAYALLLADKQWGSSGPINYKAEALMVMNDILAKDVNPTDRNLLCGDIFFYDSDMGHTRPSDFMVNHLLAFAAADPAHASQWRNVYQKICAIVNWQYNYGGSAGTGLMPDFMVNSGGNFVPVTGQYVETTNDGDFYWNACRTPWRLPMAYIVSGRREILAALRTQNSWIQTKTDGTPANILSGYYIKNGPNGTPLNTDKYLVFTAPFAVEAMIDPNSQQWLNKLWTSITGGDYGATTDYYGDTVRMQVLLVVSGNWWLPEKPPGGLSNGWLYLLLSD